MVVGLRLHDIFKKDFDIIFKNDNNFDNGGCGNKIVKKDDGVVWIGEVCWNFKPLDHEFNLDYNMQTD